jgi:hypothetical protein
MQKAIVGNKNPKQKLPVKWKLLLGTLCAALCYGRETPEPKEHTSLGHAAFVEAGGSLTTEILISGEPDAERTVLIRALGPSLEMADALQDPTLEVRDANGIVASNDDWQSNQEATIRATGLAPLRQQESAIIVGLSVGHYTATVRGKDGEKGQAMVEAYILK